MEAMNDDRPLVLAAARVALDNWTDLLGTSGRAAMTAAPGLVAAVDQHLAEVRAAVTDCFGHLSAVALAGYADGLADVAAAKGWSATEVRAGGWAAASWPSLRLLAVCELYRTAC